MATKKTIKETTAKVADETKKAVTKVKDSKPVKKVAAGAKTAAAKTKKTAEKVTTKVNTYVEFAGKQISTEELEEKVRADYKAKSKTRIKTIEIYVKPEDSAAYYVVNGKADEGNKIDL